MSWDLEADNLNVGFIERLVSYRNTGEWTSEWWTKELKFGSLCHRTRTCYSEYTTTDQEQVQRMGYILYISGVTSKQDIPGETNQGKTHEQLDYKQTTNHGTRNRKHFNIKAQESTQGICNRGETMENCICDTVVLLFLLLKVY